MSPSIIIYSAILGNLIYCKSAVSILGLPQSKLFLYQPNREFVCLDGSLSIPYDWVNDDFCDCPDGTDEPSTSACVQSFFHCMNLGYHPLDIPSSRVKDGICDCCDGSDEHGLTDCANTCLYLRDCELAENLRLVELIDQGNAIRHQMIAEGKQLRYEKIVNLSKLEEKLKRAEQVKDDLEIIKLSWEGKQNEAMDRIKSYGEKGIIEKTEKETKSTLVQAKEIFNEMDKNKDSLLQADEMLIKLKSLEICESEIKSFLEEEVIYIMNMKSELTFDDFFEVSWNHFKALLATKKRKPVPDALEENPNYIDNTNSIKSKEIQDFNEDYSYDSNENDSSNDEAELTMNNYDKSIRIIINETLQAIEMFENAEKTFKVIEQQSINLKKSIDTNFGLNDEFLPLERQCFTYITPTYNYTLCPFNKITQSGLNGGCGVNLGVWKDWEFPYNFSTMLYDGGDDCWNGPKRSAKVQIICGRTNELYSAEEPDKCVYVLNFRTPAACNNSTKIIATSVHDEL